MQSFFNPPKLVQLVVRSLCGKSLSDAEKRLEQLDIHTLKIARQVIDGTIGALQDPSPFYIEQLQTVANIPAEKAVFGVEYYLRYSKISCEILEIDQAQWMASASLWGKYAAALINYRKEKYPSEKLGHLIEEYIIKLSVSNTEEFLQAFNTYEHEKIARGLNRATIDQLETIKQQLKSHPVDENMRMGMICLLTNIIGDRQYSEYKRARFG